MEIAYLGQSAFKIKGKASTVAIDPFSDKFGKFPRDLEANMLLVTHDHPDHNDTSKVEGKPFVINGPGEYEVGGVSVIGVATYHDDKQGEERGSNTVYVIEMDNLRVAHLGDLGHKLTQDQLDQIGSIDIAIVPVGGYYTIDGKVAAEVVKQLDPWVVIPMHYQQEGLPAEVQENLAPVTDFLKEMSKTDVVPIPKYVVTADKLPTELQVIVLEKK